MTLQELEDSIRIKVDDTRSTRFTLDQVRLMINEASKALYRKLLGSGIYTNTGLVTVSFVAGIRESSIVDSNNAIIRDLQKGIFVVLASDSTPIPVIPRKLCLESDQPSCYISRVTTSYREEGYKETNKLGWYKVPTSAFNVELYYAKKLHLFLPNYDNALYQINDIPDEWHDALTALTASLLLGSDEKNAAFWYSVYQDHISEIIEGGGIDGSVSSQVVDVNYGNN